MREAIADSKEELEKSVLMMQAGDETEHDDIEMDGDQGSDQKQKKSTKASKAKTDVDPDAKVTRKELDATRLYLREIEGSPLLTAEEEVFSAAHRRRGSFLLS